MTVCDAQRADGEPCWYRATWSVLTLEAEREVCGVHARCLVQGPTTLAMEPLEDTEGDA